MSSDIAIVGMAAAGANGASAGALWDACLAGVSGIGRRRGAVGGGATDIVGEIPEAAFASPYLEDRDARVYDRSQILAVALSAAALGEAAPHPYPPERVGVVIGTAAGPLEIHADTALAEDAGGRRAVSARYPAAGSASFGASLAAIRLGLRGPVLATSAACSTFAHTLVVASQLLLAGDADLVLAGAVNLLLTPATIAGFANMRVLADHADPARACRPLDRSRSGLVLSEGGAVFALEREEAAARRDAPIRAVLLGYGITSDAGGIMAPEAEGVARAVALALARAGVDGGEIDHLSLHAAGTPLGDLAEAQALRSVLGDRVGTVPATAPKSMLGHAMGAAGGLETTLLVRSLETGRVPPTMNLEEVDPQHRAGRRPRRASRADAHRPQDLERPRGAQRRARRRSPALSPRGSVGRDRHSAEGRRGPDRTDRAPARHAGALQPQVDPDATESARPAGQRDEARTRLAELLDRRGDAAVRREDVDDVMHARGEPADRAPGREARRVREVRRRSRLPAQRRGAAERQDEERLQHRPRGHRRTGR